MKLYSEKLTLQKFFVKIESVVFENKKEDLFFNIRLNKKLYRKVEDTK